MSVEDMVSAALDSLKLSGKTVFYVTVEYDDPDERKQNTSKRTLATILTDLAEEWINDPESFRHITRQSLFDFLGDQLDDLECQLLYLETEDEMQKRVKITSRRELEVLAREIAENHHFNCDSIEFIKLVSRLIDREDEYRYGLREDGLCATAYPGSIAGVDQWCEMHEDSYNRQSRLREMLEWLANYCPLLWAEWQEHLRTQEIEEDKDD